jgi:predicted porin
MNKKLLTVAIAGAMAAPMTANAVKYKVSGQVNRAVVFQDDGVQSDVRSVDSISSGTRFRFRGSEDLGNGMKVGMYYEMQTSSNPSSSSRPDQNAARNTDALQVRQANVWFSGNWGKLSVGQLDGAANGGAEADLSGTTMSGTGATGRNSYTGGMQWRTTRAGGAQLTNGGTALRAGNTYNSNDGFSRYDGIRYDAPALGPVSLRASVGNDQLWDVAARLNTALGGGKLSGAVFYGQASGPENVDARWGGSLSYLFSQGTSIGGHYSENEPDAVGATDAKSFSVKLGHKWGPHAVSIGYANGEDFQVGFEEDGFELGYVHSLKKASTQLYASFQHAELDVPAAIAAAQGNAEDHNSFVVGARVQFK